MLKILKNANLVRFINLKKTSTSVFGTKTFEIREHSMQDAKNY